MKDETFAGGLTAFIDYIQYSLVDILSIPLTKQQIYILIEAVVSRKIGAKDKPMFEAELNSVQNALSSALREQSLGIRVDVLDDEIY